MKNHARRPRVAVVIVFVIVIVIIVNSLPLDSIATFSGVSDIDGECRTSTIVSRGRYANAILEIGSRADSKS